MRTFRLQRDKDLTGVSGTGVVAEGVQFTDGSVVLRWLGDIASTVHYDVIDHVRRIHGHDGWTRVRWDDEDTDALKREG